MDCRRKNISILMLPWLAYGHISSFFELAKKLSLRNFQIYFCSSPINLQSIREICPDYTHKFPLIHFVDIHLQHLPPHYHTTKDLPPHLMSTLKTAFDESKPAFCNLLDTFRPDLVIYDFLEPWVPESANQLNIKAVLFLTCGAAACSFMTHSITGTSSLDFPVREFIFPEDESKRITQFLHDTANGVRNSDRYLECITRSNNMVLIKTSTEIESKYIDCLSVLSGNKEIIPVGPLVEQEPSCKGDNDEYIMSWLGQKERGSVVFVSFGTEYFLSKEEMEEIAHGLELSKTSFIWVVRFHGGEKMKAPEALPEGFLRRVEERGLVVEGWAPQTKILGHGSIGGFVSHCGWSSTVEGIVFGVPIIAIPMQLDQPFNAKLVEEMGVGRVVARKDGRVVVDRKKFAAVISEVVGDQGEQAEMMKRRAKELSGKLRERGDAEMDLAVEKLAHLVST